MLLTNSDADSALVGYDLASGHEVRRYFLTSKGHLFNDLAVARNGDVYLTDTRAASIWYLARDASELVRLSGRFQSANGVALSADGRLLYVSSYPEGIQVFDLKSHTAIPIPRPPGVCLTTIDGLYYRDGWLVAIQNGVVTPRVVRMKLSRDGGAVEGLDVLERRNPLFDGVTTGVVIGREFFYMANIQDDKKVGFDPITILKVRL